MASDAMHACPTCGAQAQQGRRFCPQCRVFMACPEVGVQASQWRRIGATLVDPVIGVLQYSGLYYFFSKAFVEEFRFFSEVSFDEFGYISGFLNAKGNSIPQTAFTWLITVVAWGTLMGWALGHGKTPGKWLFGLRVVQQETGAYPGKGWMFVRELLFKPFNHLIWEIGYISVWLHPERQGLHDKVTQTVVVRDPPKKKKG